MSERGKKEVFWLCALSALLLLGALAKRLLASCVASPEYPYRQEQCVTSSGQSSNVSISLDMFKEQGHGC
jgi:hypothetical protein